MSDSNPFRSTPIPAGPSVGQPDVVDPLRESTALLAQTKPWVRFLSVLGFITAGIATSVSLLTAFIEGDGPPDLPGGAGLVVAVQVVVMFAISVSFYFIPSVLLWKYASRIDEHLRETDPPTFLAALSAQTSFWRYLGVLTLILIALYGVAMLAFVLLPPILGAMG